MANILRGAALLSILMYFPPVSASAQNSVNCESPKTDVERAICGSRDLKDLDRQFEAAYVEAVRLSPSQSTVAQWRKYFIEGRDGCGAARDQGRRGVADCLSYAYRLRLPELLRHVSQLRSSAATAAPAAAVPTTTTNAADSPTTAAQNSVNCASPKTNVERAVCGSADLLQQDGKVGDQYASVLALLPSSAEEVRARLEWLRSRDSCGESAGGRSGDEIFKVCLEQAYRERSMYLERRLEQLQPLAGTVTDKPATEPPAAVSSAAEGGAVNPISPERASGVATPPTAVTSVSGTQQPPQNNAPTEPTPPTEAKTLQQRQVVVLADSVSAQTAKPLTDREGAKRFLYGTMLMEEAKNAPELALVKTTDPKAAELYAATMKTAAAAVKSGAMGQHLQTVQDLMAAEGDTSLKVCLDSIQSRFADPAWAMTAQVDYLVSQAPGTWVRAAQLVDILRVTKGNENIERAVVPLYPTSDAALQAFNRARQLLQLSILAMANKAKGGCATGSSARPARELQVSCTATSITRIVAPEVPNGKWTVYFTRPDGSKGQWSLDSTSTRTNDCRFYWTF